MAETRKLIMIIEDNPDITSLIELVLRKAPADTIHMSTANEARVHFEKQKPDLILLDMMLPGISGMDFLASLREDPRYRTLPVIVVSIRADSVFRRRAQELGVARYLMKPFSPAVLRQEVEQALGVNWQAYWAKSGH
jgi:two-component system phosphate regulon response regulator PhoB